MNVLTKSVPLAGIILWQFPAAGRGITDCGESAVWRYDGHAFHLIGYHHQPSCDGGQPGDWPSLWTTPGDTNH